MPEDKPGRVGRPTKCTPEDFTVEFRDPRVLSANPQNYRHHPPAQIAEIKRNLRDLGQYKNVVIRPDGTILAGHGVVQAAQELGWPQVAVHVFTGSEAKARRLMVADNELWRMAEDDDAALASLLEEVSRDFGDLSGTGWDEEAFKGLLEKTRFDPDEIEFREYDENIDTSGIRMATCPECGNEFPL